MGKRHPKLEYSLICDDIREETGKKFSIMGIHPGAIRLPIPVVLPRLCFYLAFRALSHGDKLAIQLIDPSNKTLLTANAGPFEFPNELPKNKSHRGRLHLQFTGINIQQEGTYMLVLIFNGDENTKQDLNFSIIKG